MGVDVGVQLRCQDGFVPEHLLHNPQIGTILNKVRGKRMPERMGDISLFTPAARACRFIILNTETRLKGLPLRLRNAMSSAAQEAGWGLTSR